MYRNIGPHFSPNSVCRGIDLVGGGHHPLHHLCVRGHVRDRREDGLHRYDEHRVQCGRRILVHGKHVLQCGDCGIAVDDDTD